MTVEVVEGELIEQWQHSGGTDMEKAVPWEQRSTSFLKVLKLHRELLVSHIKNTQCILYNLVQNEYFSNEDAEIAAQFPTQTDKVRKILDQVQSKGEEASEYFVLILYQATDAYIDLRPWFDAINYRPSEYMQSKSVINTDPVSQYSAKLKQELVQDTKFMSSYVQKEEMLLEETYTDTIMELVSEVQESLGNLKGLTALFDENGVINKDGETIFITGDAGVGKSILLQKLQNMWAKSKLSVNAKFFYKFRCRMFSTFREGEEVSLKDLLFKYNCYPDHDIEEVFDYMLKYPDTILFTFDGFDEIHSDFDLDSIPEVSSPFHPTHPLALLMNILSGKLLRGSRKILTARTDTEVEKKILRKKVILRGFSNDNLQRYTRIFFKDTETCQTLVLTHLKANPHLCSLCSVPLFCWIIFKCYQHFHSAYNTEQLPDCSVTLTDVYLLMAEVFLNRSVKTNQIKKKQVRSQVETFMSKKEVLIRLGKLAHKGTEKTDFIFNEEEMSSVNMPEQDLQLGFLRPVSHYDDCENQSTYEFLHSTLQSFFTALSLVVDDDVSSKKLLRFFSECESQELQRNTTFLCQCLRPNAPVGKDPFQNNEHFQFTNMFLCGLLSKNKHKLFKHLVSDSNIKKKRALLKAYLFNTVKNHLKKLPRLKMDGHNRVQAMPHFIWMLRCIYETQSEDIGKLAAKGICADYIKLTYCNACSSDCSAITFVLHHCSKQLALELDNNNINDYGVKELIPCFSKLTVVRLSVNQVTDSGAEVLSEELIKYKIIKHLTLYKNQITDAGAVHIAKIIEECPNLRILKIGINKITSVGGKMLACAIQRSKSIFDVGMWGNRIGDEGAKAFAEALKNHPSLTNLSLAFNGISTEGGKSIAAALQENSSVRIFWLTKNEFNDEVAGRFAEMLKVNTTLRNLWLIENQITAKGAKHLMEALQENKHITEI
ncbi:nucleotide-binding oligomerization domain-containing protein 1 isoform X2 [Latimeria chalumnae]